MINLKVDTLKKYWAHYSELVNSWKYRDRLVLLVVSLLVIYFIYWMALSLPVSSKVKKVKLQKAAVMKQISELSTKISQLRIEILRSKTEASEKKTEEDKTPELNKYLELFEQKNVTSTQIADTLRNLINRENGLELLDLQNSAERALFLGGKRIVYDNHQFYQRGFEIKLRGDFFSTMDYLQKLERSQKQLYWNDIDYQVMQYPEAEVVIRVHTISREEVPKDAK